MKGEENVKQIWKKMLVACCTATLLLNAAEFTVQADNVQEEIVTSENVVSDTESGLESTSDESLIDTGEEDEEKAESYISEEQVGNGILETWTVGDNVTVELLPTESGGYFLNFQIPFRRKCVASALLYPNRMSLCTNGDRSDATKRNFLPMYNVLLNIVR